MCPLLAIRPHCVLACAAPGVENMPMAQEGENVHMRVLRFLGYLLTVLGLFVAGLAFWLWIDGRDLSLPAGQLWFELDSSGLNTVQAVVQRYMHPAIWDDAIVPLLQKPAKWALTVEILMLLVPGVLLVLIGRRKRRRYR